MRNADAVDLREHVDTCSLVTGEVCGSHVLKDPLEDAVAELVGSRGWVLGEQRTRLVVGPEGLGAYVGLPNFLIVAARRAA